MSTRGIVILLCGVSLAAVTFVEFQFNTEPGKPFMGVEAKIDSLGRERCETGRSVFRGWCRLNPQYPWFQYPIGEYVDPRNVSATWNEAGSAVCPNGFDYYDKLCVPRVPQ
jgi:hypothetical protein